MTVSSNIYEEQQGHASGLYLGWGGSERGCPNLPTCPASWSPKLPAWEEALFNVNRREQGSALVGAASAGCEVGRGTCQETIGRQGAICLTRPGEGESGAKHASPQSQHEAFSTRVKYRPISVKAPACFYKYLSQFSGVLM